MISRLHVYNMMIHSGIIPVFYMNNPQQAESFVTSCIEGGIQVFEMTNRGTAALSIFQHLRTLFPKLILGIGSIVDAPTAALYLSHGADFIVSPTFNSTVSTVCNQHKVAYIPGCGSATEIQTAHTAGAEIIKLFPASEFSPSFIKAIRGPLPWTRIMPTGGIGITEDAIKPWFEAGVSCIGIGNSLSKVDDVTNTCSNLLAWIEQYRQDNPHV